MAASNTSIRNILLPGVREVYWQMKVLTPWPLVTADEEILSPGTNLFDIISEFRDKDDGKENRIDHRSE